MSLISVIIPIYKVEKYMERCIKSVAEQTYKNLEIILVDDGSPDNCPVLCDEWAMKDIRIKVVHKDNGGLSDARNAGLAIASGDYIGFIDGDDYINPFMYETLMKAMTDSGSDITSCQFQMFPDGEDAPLVSACNGYHVLDRRETMSSLIDNTTICQVVWNKLYRKSLVEDIPFLVGKYHEDEFWSYQVLGKARKVAVVDYIGYNYLQRKESIMGANYSIRRLDAIEAKILRQQYLEEALPDSELTNAMIKRFETINRLHRKFEDYSIIYDSLLEELDNSDPRNIIKSIYAKLLGIYS